ncbi:MAG: hypothetical protein JO279_08305, partial [Verrucomicrobia bacterium]|nr:hypothetical protein [Verrucomicrobiota bacterium]
MRELLTGEAELLPPVALGSQLPAADAVLFPQFLGEGYRRVQDFRRISIPILVVTSEFGTVSMWDWELISYLQAEGVQCIGPNNLEETKMLCRALGVRRELETSKFIVYQDNPGEGQQAPIFKRFYWWESECTRRMTEKFGITIEKRSYKELGQRAKQIDDASALEISRGWKLPESDLSDQAATAAARLYLAVRRDIQNERQLVAIGMNCLNESHFSDSTPCQAWNRLYQEMGLLWGCEADTVSMLSKFILHRTLRAPIFMTNLYPFLLGQAALKHERIASFPRVNGDPDNYVLIGHCGYMGVIPQPFASEWKLRAKVLAIVDKDANAIDARIPEGDVTLAKLASTFDKMTVAEATLEGYAQFPNSDCRNGGI